MTDKNHPKGNYIDGHFVSVEKPCGEICRLNPSHLEEEIGRFSFSLESIDQAIFAAKKAYGPWSNLSFEKRWSFLHRLSEIFLKNQKILAQTLSKEIGKPLWEAKLELTNVQNKFIITQKESMPLIRDFSITLKNKNIKGFCHFKSRGSLAVIAPFNFPFHLAMGHIIPALACGNTIILKPSELAPLTSQFLCELFNEAELPPGVFNMIQGDGSVGKSLCQHPEISGILFTGSYKVGKSIAETALEHPHKICALEMGGKNTSVIWDDENLENTVKTVLQSATITTGQRCTCTSKILIHKNIWLKTKPLFLDFASKIKIGDPFAKDTFMGPLVSVESKKRFLDTQDLAKEIGAISLLPQNQDLSSEGNFVQPSLHFLEEFDSSNGYSDEEIFGPDMGIYIFENTEDAVKIIEASHYGLAVSIFSKNKKVFEEFFGQITAGVINWNRPTTGASSKLPFGGQKASGNDSPTALFAPYYCTYPVASMQDETGSSLDDFPGFP